MGSGAKGDAVGRPVARFRYVVTDKLTGCPDALDVGCQRKKRRPDNAKVDFI